MSSDPSDEPNTPQESDFPASARVRRMERLYPDGPSLTIPKPDPATPGPKAMPQHRIQLRAAWSCQAVGGQGAALGRIDLPAGGLASLGGEFHLSRGFGSPPIDPDRETVRLVLEAVPGLKAVRLNGDVLEASHEGSAMVVVSLDGKLQRRNRLVLEVDAACAGNKPWGEIALVIDDRRSFTES